MTKKQLEWKILEEHTGAWLLMINKNEIWHYKISDEYLQYALLNEIFCKNVLGWKWLCKQALEKELDYIPLNIKEEYIKWRIEFFRNMFLHYQIEDNTDWNMSYKEEMKESYKYLEWVLKKLEIAEQTDSTENKVINILQ